MTETTETTETTEAPDTTGQPETPVATAVVTPPRRRGRFPFGGVRRVAGGVGAVGVKELRGRMRGRRAFVILTLYLVLLAGFGWMVELIMERTYSTSFGGNTSFATASIGQGIFAALLMLETLLVAFLAPMATAGSISLEREKQTLEMLSATPISSFAIVVGKLFSALIYVWLLIAASIPLTAVVFVFGGVAPDDLVRGYLVLVVTAVGFGSFGLFCSSLVKRTQAATAITIFGVLAVSIGTLFAIVFWQALATSTSSDATRGGVFTGSAPEPVAFLNPFLAQADVTPVDSLCATDNALRYYCRFRSTFVTDQTVTGGVNFGVGIAKPAPVFVGGGTGGGTGGGIVVAPDQPVQQGADIQPFGPTTDTIWPKTVVAWLLLSVVFLLASVQFVSPTRRWHLRRGPRRREATN